MYILCGGRFSDFEPKFVVQTVLTTILLCTVLVQSDPSIIPKDPKRAKQDDSRRYCDNTGGTLTRQRILSFLPFRLRSELSGWSRVCLDTPPEIELLPGDDIRVSKPEKTVVASLYENFYRDSHRNVGE